MTGDEILVAGAEEDSGDREAAVAAALGDARLLQQRQGAAAGADEDEPRADPVGLVGEQILDGEVPPVGGALEIGDLVAGAHGCALVRNVAEQLARQRPEVDIGALLDPRDAVDLARSAALEHQRQPFGLSRRVVGVLHLGEQRVAHHRLVAAFDVVTALVAAAVADVGDGVDEGLRVGEHTGVDEMRPVLARVVELLVDRRGLLQVDVAVGVLRSVVEFAECGVAGARIVPRVRALSGYIVELLVDTDVPIGLKFGQHGAQSGAHDAAADQDDVDFFLRCGHLDSHSSSLTTCIRLSGYSPASAHL